MFGDKEIEVSVEETANAPKRSRGGSKSRITVRSQWPRDINGFVLLESDGNYRLQPAADSKNIRVFEMDKSAFESLEKPASLNIGGLEDAYLWRAGIVGPGSYSLGPVQEAIHMSGAKLSPTIVIEMLKAN